MVVLCNQVDLVLEVEKFIPLRLRRKSKLFRINAKEVVCDSQQKSLIARLKPHPALSPAVRNAMRNSKVSCRLTLCIRSQLVFLKPKFHDQFYMTIFYDKFPCSCRW